MDYSILSTPIGENLNIAETLVMALQNGVEDLFTLNDDVIFECVVCKQLFRSLVNFLMHKRISCPSISYVKEAQSPGMDLEAGVDKQSVLAESATLPSRRYRTDLLSVLENRRTPNITLAPTLEMKPINTTSVAYSQTIIYTNSEQVTEGGESDYDSNTSSIEDD